MLRRSVSSVLSFVPSIPAAIHSCLHQLGQGKLRDRFPAEVAPIILEALADSVGRHSCHTAVSIFCAFEICLAGD